VADSLKTWSSFAVVTRGNKQRTAEMWLASENGSGALTIAHQHCAILGAGHAVLGHNTRYLGNYLRLFTTICKEEVVNYTEVRIFGKISTSGF